MGKVNIQLEEIDFECILLAAHFAAQRVTDLHRRRIETTTALLAEALRQETGRNLMTMAGEWPKER